MGSFFVFISERLSGNGSYSEKYPGTPSTIQKVRHPKKVRKRKENRAFRDKARLRRNPVPALTVFEVSIGLIDDMWLNALPL